MVYQGSNQGLQEGPKVMELSEGQNCGGLHFNVGESGKQLDQWQLHCTKHRAISNRCRSDEVK